MEERAGLVASQSDGAMSVTVNELAQKMVKLQYDTSTTNLLKHLNFEPEKYIYVNESFYEFIFIKCLNYTCGNNYYSHSEHF